MSLYGTNVTDGNGTTVTTDGSATIEGANGPEWSTEVAVGDLFKIEDEAAIYTIASITDDDTLVLSAAYAAADGGGKSYLIIKDFTDKFLIPMINKGDLDWPDIYTEAMKIIDLHLKQYSYVSVTSTPYTALVANEFFAVDTSTAKEIDLLSAGTYGKGRIIIVKDVTGSAGTNNITIDPNGTEKIDGGAAGVPITISTNYGSVTLISDGSNLFTI